MSGYSPLMKKLIGQTRQQNERFSTEIEKIERHFERLLEGQAKIFDALGLPPDRPWQAPMQFCVQSRPALSKSKISTEVQAAWVHLQSIMELHGQQLCARPPSVAFEENTAGAELCASASVGRIDREQI